jgi:DNA-binding Lrp family transcriptional regulator
MARGQRAPFASQMGIGQILNDRRLRLIHSLFYEQRMTQAVVARRLRCSQPAISQRLKTIRKRFVSAGLTPPANPGAGLRAVRCIGLPSYN